METTQHDLGAIADPETRTAFMLYAAQREVLRDFFALLGEGQLDFRMVDGPGRRSDSPRESLVHLVTCQRWYMGGLAEGRVTPVPLDDSAYRGLGRDGLLAELERLDGELLAILSAPGYQPDAPVDCPWGQVPSTALVHALRDHDILHIGWNLAVMDHLGLPRYPSLSMRWGA